LLSAEAVGADPLEMAPNPLEIENGGDITLTASIENLDNFDTATGIELTLTPGVGEWEMLSMDDRCVAQGDEFVCSLNELRPTAPNENEPFVFTMQAIGDGQLRIDAAVLSAEIDDKPANDVAASVISVAVGDPSDINVQLLSDRSEYVTGDSVGLGIVVKNVGEFAAEQVVVNASIPQGLLLDTSALPAGCSAQASDVQCTVGTVGVDRLETMQLKMRVLIAGLYTLSANADAENDTNAANNQDAISVSVANSQIDITPTTGETGGSTEGSETAGQTAGETTVGQTSVGETGGSTSGTTGSEVTPSTSTAVSVPSDDDSGAMTHWLLWLFC